MADDQRIIELARRGELEPESLTTEEIRELGFAVMCDLNDSGEQIQGVIGSVN